MKTCIQQPRRGMTGVASRFRSALPLGSSKKGWEKDAMGKRAVGTRPAAAFCRVPKGTLSIVAADIPAIEMAGYRSCVPSVARPEVERSDAYGIGLAELTTIKE